MKLETIYFKATDGINLTGVLFQKEEKKHKIAISIHGMATSCLKKREDAIAKQLNEIGMDYLIFNNRGHDLMNYMEQQIEEKKETKIIGMAFEDIKESYFDILGAIQEAKKQGYEEIYLLGHSLGCTKIIYTYHQLIQKQEKDILEKIKGIILLSLIDIPMALKVYLRDQFPVMLTYAQNLEKEKLLDQFMPRESFIHPISVKTFLQYARDYQDFDFARYLDKQNEFCILNEIKIPLFMRWGNQNELIVQEAEELCEMLKNKIKNEKADISYIDGADHNYTGKEEVLGKQIKSFLENN